MTEKRDPIRTDVTTRNPAYRLQHVRSGWRGHPWERLTIVTVTDGVKHIELPLSAAMDLAEDILDITLAPAPEGQEGL